MPCLHALRWTTLTPRRLFPRLICGYTGDVFGKALRLVAFGRMARMGPLGIALAAYGLWRQLSAEDQEHVRQRARSLVRRVKSGAPPATRG
jgi:hypothetical protein